MQCKSCGYHLWNISSRACPECGEGFLPEDYDFVPNAVAFCCPHCDQNYFGTDEHGHLNPKTFECIGCQTSIDLNEMVLRPGPGYEADAATVWEHPWEDRGSRPSTFRAWYRTAWAAMIRPKELVQQGFVQNKKSGHWRFLLCNSLLIYLLGFGTIFLSLITVALTAGGGNTFAGGMIAAIGGMALFGVLINFFTVLVFGAVAHGSLRLFGKPQGTLSDTYRCYCYSNGVTAMMAVPICGFYLLSWVGGIWWMVSAIIMLMEVHKVSGFKATMAVLIFPIMMLVLVTVGWIAFMMQLNQV